MGKLFNRLARASAVVGAALTMLLGVTSAAHADVAHGCRSSIPVFDGVQIGSCYHVADDGRTIYSTVPFANPNRANVVICAHLLNVNNLAGPWVWDFGCDYATTDAIGEALPGNCCYGNGEQFTAGPGTYVVSAGFWLNGQYYGDVQSPRTTIG